MSKSKQEKRILLTAAIEDVEIFKKDLSNYSVSVLHLPLERYVGIRDKETAGKLADKLKTTENIVYGHKRNAKFFIQMARQHDFMPEVKECVNFATGAVTVDYLEDQGIPAVSPGSEAPIKLLEFMLRLRRLGSTLYPCGNHKNEEIPGLLKELDIPVIEEVLYQLEGPDGEELESYREQITKNEPDLIIYHSRRSVSRMGAAFPNLNPENAVVIAGDRAVSEKLHEQEVKADFVAGGTWDSIFEKAQETI